MYVIIKNDLTELSIEINETDLTDIENQIRACLAGNYTYIDFKDKNGTLHLLTLEYLKKSYIRIM